MVETIGQHAYGAWLGSCRFEVSEGRVTVVAPSPFTRSYVDRTFGQQIAAALSRVSGDPIELAWRVEQPGSGAGMTR
ncbi:DnaA N-terminal domain-containing protein [Sphingomonas aerophila]